MREYTYGFVHIRLSRHGSSQQRNRVSKILRDALLFAASMNKTFYLLEVKDSFYQTHWTFLKQLDLWMTFDLWSGRFENMLSNLVGPSPYPLAKFQLHTCKHDEMHSRTYIHTHTHTPTPHTPLHTHTTPHPYTHTHIYLHPDLDILAVQICNIITVQLK